MVLVMESDGSLTATQSQNSFARNYNDGVGQGSAADALAIFDQPDVATATEEIRVAAIAPRAPLPRADVLSAIEATALGPLPYQSDAIMMVSTRMVVAGLSGASAP